MGRVGSGASCPDSTNNTIHTHSHSQIHLPPFYYYHLGGRGSKKNIDNYGT